MFFDANSEEQFKWYLILLNENPHIFEKLLVYTFFEEKSKRESFEERISSWLKHNKISIDQGEKVEYNNLAWSLPEIP